MASPRRLILYLLGWIPILALVAWVVWAAGGISWTQVFEALAPACFIYAFACLSPWYVCRTHPLRLSQAAGLIAMWAVAAAGASILLLGCAALAAYLFDRGMPHPGLLFGMGVLLYVISGAVHYTALAGERSAEADRRAAEARSLARESELAALRFQLNPHFLFNSLHSIAALATTDGVRAREMCIRLSDFLRASLGLQDRESIPLREELALARSYLEVEHIRFGGRLEIREEIGPDCEDCAVPALLLQPLVENAIKHGIAGLLEGGAIVLEARRVGGAVNITVENAFDPESSASRKTGIGLPHVRRRLAVRYGEDAAFEAGPRGEIYHVEMRLPCESPIASSSRA